VIPAAEIPVSAKTAKLPDAPRLGSAGPAAVTENADKRIATESNAKIKNFDLLFVILFF